jgi:hypothetical protein
MEHQDAWTRSQKKGKVGELILDAKRGSKLGGFRSRATWFAATQRHYYRPSPEQKLEAQHVCVLTCSIGRIAYAKVRAERSVFYSGTT